MIWLYVLNFILLFLPIRTLAFCPVCVVATGTFTIFCRRMGVDDTIISLWLGGFIISFSVLFNNFLLKRGKKIKFQLPIVLASFYFLTLLALYWDGCLTAFYNKIFGVNKIIFGLVIGSLLVWFTPYLDKFLRRKNKGKVFIYYQKVILAVLSLLIFSLIFYFLTK